MNQVNFQKLSSIVLFYMFRWYWLKSHAVTSERNSLTYVTSWAFITSKEGVSLISICFFLKHSFLIPTVLTVILKKDWLKSRFCDLIPLIYNQNCRDTCIFWESCLWRVAKEKIFLKIKPLCCFWDLKGYFYTNWLLGQACCVRLGLWNDSLLIV